MLINRKLYFLCVMRSTLIALAILLCIGCGTRKASTQIAKVDIKDKSEQISTGSSSTESKATGSTETNEQLAKTDEKQESRTRELYDENGKLKERITELINSKSADNSKRLSVGRYDINTRVNTAYTNTIYRTVTIHTKDKEKTVTSNRNGLYTLLFGIGVVAILCFGAYKMWG